MNKSIALTLTLSIVVSAVTSAFTWTVFQDMDDQPSPTKNMVVVDFTTLSQRLMVSMRDRITQSDMTLNQDLIELMAQSEARRLLKEVVNHSPDAVVLNKSSIVNAPDSLDITDEIADSMGLEELTPEAIKEFINGPEVKKPVGVK
ncbi:MAG: hypothetical protein CL600_09905 [Alteromonas sp.]|jgi:hypothetical protein|nr:hypothetical protein [Alteromonas sp.]